MEEQSDKNKQKRETYLLRIDKDLFFQISDYVQKTKKKSGRRNYSFNKFVIEAVVDKLKKTN